MNLKNTKPVLSIILFIALLTMQKTVMAQFLPDSITVKIDQLFAKWNNNYAPGCVAGIVQGDKLVYAKGFGLANLENGVPNTPQSIFYMCSVSKQFAGYAISLLAGEGKINIDNDIHVYLPWMANFGGRKITVRNLLNHTSGIRDDIGLAEFFGLNADGILTQQQAVYLLKKQHTLNFTPGEKFSYSNSNYILLAEIVKNVSGKSFKAYTDSAIFKPLGMSSSTFIDDYSTVIKNRASSYGKDNDIYHNAVQNVYTLGDGGLFTNIEDMAKWVANFYQPKAGTLKDIALMTTPGKLNDGKAITYAMGINSGQDRGHLRFIHNGGLAGYRTIITVYPELKIGFLIFGNDGDADVYNKANQLSEILVRDGSVKNNKTITPENAPVIVIKDSLTLKKWIGNYVAPNGYKVAVSYRSGKLYINGNAELAPESPGLFHMAVRSSVKYQFTFNLKTKTAQAHLSSPVLTKPIEMTRVREIQVSKSLLTNYTGAYFSDELECSFKIELKENELWISNKNHDPVKIRLLGPDDLFTGYDFLSHVRIQRDARSKITGFELNSGETSGLFFKKI
ncbi:beta-lactamase family protein [Mucilaginibacter rubeus]|uniref:Beta-lactamase family protein n=1 Tax=Mucilaginibacter rubeus TaxID=2027860 RepID=A0AAE6MKJ4_9SPHI|nr:MULTISPECIES: serine hydrolase domain-containing protein [Mucilaginibacter]QEM06514.1 beta-lactamase family protein [Mucilaginibacter rubeus]QEM19103.1 beta-lactamase family protein [Mucilaginibacter gossypii]QTE44356.1 beta-lactamase family protein [Mucilaginibacter rubeus]QTE50956.1 beta-lactamase family protein [Mucilaginibacter rubeus]QTE56039.1 beta-lactamase family protein [Mucilaginibacter rubeus]